MAMPVGADGTILFVAHSSEWAGDIDEQLDALDTHGPQLGSSDRGRRDACLAV
jgi:hypothetical protein